MEIQHTETPWKWHAQGDANEYCLLTSGGDWVISFRQNGGLIDAKQRANAAFIVKACNTHDLLIAALEQVLELGANGPGRDVFARIAEEALAGVAEYEAPSAQPAMAKLDIASPPHSCAAVAPPQTC